MRPPERRSGPATHGPAQVRAAAKQNRRSQSTPDLLAVLDGGTGQGVAGVAAQQLLGHLAMEAAAVLHRRGVEDAHERAEVVSRWLARLAVEASDRALVPPEPGGGGAA